MTANDSEANDYDLGSTDTIASVQMGGAARLGWRIEATGAADYVVEIRGNDVGWMQIDSYSGVSSVDDGKIAPEALQARIRNTSTNATETADVLMGSDG